MSASNPPTYVVSIYNPSFFTTTTTGLTQGQANGLYLSKTVADTASGIETFTSGTKSSNYDVVTPSSVMLIGTSQTSSFMAIGCADSRSGNITLASGATQSANVNLCVGATNTGAVNISNGATNSGSVHIADGANNSGAVNIANATTNTGAIHIGDNGLGAASTITIGSSTMPTTIGSSTLTLPTISLSYATIPTFTTAQIGYTYPISCSASGTFTSGVQLLYGTQLVTIQGVYLINCTGTALANCVMTSKQSSITADTLVPTASTTIAQNVWGMSGNTFSSGNSESMNLTAIFSVVKNTTFNFYLTYIFTGTSMSTTTSGFRMTVTRIA